MLHLKEHACSRIQYAAHSSCITCLCRAVSKVFKGKTIEKGVAFPTCVSVNR